MKRKSEYLSHLVLREFGVDSLICGLRFDPESGLGQVSGRIWDWDWVWFGSEVYGELDLLFNNPTLTVKAWPLPAFSSEY